MSLKAKIEAVIYASEEPVTLGQLVSLLGMEGQAELDRRESGQGALPLEVSESETGVPGEATSPEPMSEGPDMGHPEAEILSEPMSEGADMGHPGRRRARLREFFRELVDELVRDYATSERGLEVREVAGGYRMATKPEYHDAVRGFVRSLKPPLKLSLQALETLAVVAYKQPVTAPEVSEIRGVDSGGVLGSLIGRKLITTAGRKQVIGRPNLYKTTKDFLLRFGLKDLSELPSIEEFEKMAGEMAAQEEMAMPTIKPSTSPQEGITAGTGTLDAVGEGSPQADGDSRDLPSTDGQIAGSTADGAHGRGHSSARDETLPSEQKGRQ